MRLTQRRAVLRATLGVRLALGTLAAGIISGCDTDAPAAPPTPGSLAPRTDFGVWQPTWTMSTIPPLPAHDRTNVADISDNGRVVGASWLASSEPFPSPIVRPFVWTQATGSQELPTPGYTGGTAHAVSDDGAYIAGNVGSRGVRWRIWRSVVVSFDTLPSCGMGLTTAYGVNNAGTVVGYAHPPYSDTYTAIKWTSATSCPTIIKVNGVAMHNARDINNNGVIVGVGFSPTRGFMTGSGALPSKLMPLPGDEWSVATAVNDNREVVGVSWKGVGQIAMYRNPTTGTTTALGETWYGVAPSLSGRGRTIWAHEIGGRTAKGAQIWSLPFVPFGVNACGDMVGNVGDPLEPTSVLYKKAVCDFSVGPVATQILTPP